MHARSEQGAAGMQAARLRPPPPAHRVGELLALPLTLFSTAWLLTWRAIIIIVWITMVFFAPVLGIAQVSVSFVVSGERAPPLH